MKNKSFVTNPEQHFDTKHLKADLKGRSVRGGAVTMVSQGCKFVLQMGSTVVLARLLTPQDYGLIGMVTAVTGFVTLFKDLGLSMATVQKDEINHSQISTLFWVNVGLSVATMLLTALIAPVIARFYGEPRLVWITLALAAGFIFGGLAVQHIALLRRQMRFTALAAIEILSLIVGITTAIISAWYGASYWALVLWPLAGGITSTIGAWTACRWRPGLPVWQSGIRSMLAFGGHLTGFNIINYFARNLDNVLIGRYWGAQQLGLYAKAYQLLLLPIQQINAPITAVATPALSRLQNDPEQFRHYYLKALSFITFLTMPVIIFMVVMSEELIELLLGSQWREASVIFQILAISAIVQPICNTVGWLYISTGRPDRMFKWGVFASSVLVGSFFIGLPYGAKGVALCYTLAIILVTWPCIAYATRGTFIQPTHVFLTAQKPLLASLISVVPCLCLKYWFSSQINILFIVTLSLVLMAIFYCISIFYVFGMKDHYLSVFKEVKTAK